LVRRESSPEQRKEVLECDSADRDESDVVLFEGTVDVVG
jgi:hypothetical protein